MTPPPPLSPARDRDDGVLLDLARPAPAPAAGELAPDQFLAAYGLNRNPFPDAVDPGFYYQTDSHAHALGRLRLAVEYDVCLALVTGPSGTGKTLVSQLLLEHLDSDRFEPVLLLVTPGLSRTGMLREILSELSIPLPVGVNRTQELLRLLTNHIIDLYNEGRRLILLVDECHFLTTDTLHLVRTISNIEIPERKLITCLLFGESRFAQRLHHPSHESLRNRIFFRGELAPMSAEDCAQYVSFRLMVAGRLEPLFTADGLRAIHEHTGGIGRNINKLALMCLLEGCAQKRDVLDGAFVAGCAAAL